MAILNEHTQFKQITAEVSLHLLHLEDKLNRLLRVIKCSITDNTSYFLMTYDISSTGTFNYDVAKFLVHITVSYNNESIYYW